MYHHVLYKVIQKYLDSEIGPLWVFHYKCLSEDSRTFKSEVMRSGAWSVVMSVVGSYDGKLYSAFPQRKRKWTRRCSQPMGARNADLAGDSVLCSQNCSRETPAGSSNTEKRPPAHLRKLLTKLISDRPVLECSDAVPLDSWQRSGQTKAEWWEHILLGIISVAFRFPGLPCVCFELTSCR